MKKLLIYFTSLAILSVIGAVVLLKSFTISNTQPENCEIKEVKVLSVEEGTSYDVVFLDDKKNRFYINRGLERGLNLDCLKSKILNKTVTLHLAKVMGGKVTTEHISHIALGEDVIFTEFNIN